MPRHSRIKSKTNIYHVMNRGLNKQLLFDDEVDYLRYLQLIPYPSEDNPYFKYNGIAITAGELGNIAYGYWGKSLGFTDDELFYGGGVARMLVDRNYDNIWNSFITDKYYGDRPEDIEDIMKGIALYNKLHLNMGCGGAR